MRPVLISQQQIAETLEHLQQAGRRGTECVVLWLGDDHGDRISIRQVYRPDQMAQADVFRIPPESMRTLMASLSSQSLMIAAQVHSHPFEAFHSKVDDYWAIVRHVGALSLVLPDFALNTGPASFLADMKAFRLSPANKWQALHDVEVAECLQVH